MNIEDLNEPITVRADFGGGKVTPRMFKRIGAAVGHTYKVTTVNGRWVDRDLIPYVNQQLILHPRFKNETVMFVVLDDNAPAPASNALALAIRDRLLAAAVATPGVAIGWQQGRDSAGLESQAHDCAHDDVHYYIGIELTQKLDGQYAVNARALDLEDRTWVTGFGRRLDFS